MTAVGSLVTSVKGLSTAIKDVSRFREIVTILIKHGFGAFATRMHLTETMGIKSLMVYTDENDELYTVGKRIRMAFEELGPTFVKLGQILSTRGDLLPAEIVSELQHLQDNVPEITLQEVHQQIEKELGRPINELFSEFTETPLASASIAQVHRARLAHETADVVIKVQRPDILVQIDSDLNILHFLARQAEKNIPDLAMMDPVGVIAEFDRALRKELNFNNEKRNIAQFQRNFENVENVSVPRIYEDFCSPMVLVMDFIHGVKITKAEKAFGIDPYTLAPKMMQTLFKMVLEDGFFHGDMHPGNILVREDGELFLIDFGLVGRLTHPQREQILDILVGVSQQDYQLVARVFFELGTKIPGISYDFNRFEQDVIDVMENHVAGRTLEEIDVGAFFTDLVLGATRHQIKMPTNFTMVFKALITVEGIGKLMVPHVNFIESAEPYVKKMMMERYSPKRLMEETVDMIQTVSRSMRLWPGLSTQLMRDISEGRMQIRVVVKELDSMIEENRKSSTVQTQGILFGALVLGGSLALDAPGTHLFGLNAVSFFMFLAAGGLGLKLLPFWFKSK